MGVNFQLHYDGVPFLCTYPMSLPRENVLFDLGAGFKDRRVKLTLG